MSDRVMSWGRTVFVAIHINKSDVSGVLNLHPFGVRHGRASSSKEQGNLESIFNNSFLT